MISAGSGNAFDGVEMHLPDITALVKSPPIEGQPRAAEGAAADGQSEGTADSRKRGADDMSAPGSPNKTPKREK
eukprot:3685462-Lingulodinium_polyedra.AAC.1